MKILDKIFYQQNTEFVARSLLGKVLVHKYNEQVLSGKIVETEAYAGFDDLASHASRGKTKRNEIMFGAAGYWYIYLIYGMYHCLNIVTEATDYPAAVLIRAVEPLEGIDIMLKNRGTNSNKNLSNGPGKFCQAMNIDRSLNHSPATKANSALYICDNGTKLSKEEIITAPRIGVDYAQGWKDELLRFYIKKNSFVSKK